MRNIMHQPRARTWPVSFFLVGALLGAFTATVQAQIEPVTEVLFLGAEGGFPAVATDSRGRFLVAWWSYRAPGYPTFVRFVDASGTPLGAKQRVSSARQHGGIPRLAANAVGRFVVAWVGLGALGRGSGNVVGSVHDSLGDGLWHPFQAVDVDEFRAREGFFFPRDVDVALSPDGEVALTWRAANDVLGRVFSMKLDDSMVPLGPARRFGPVEPLVSPPRIGMDVRGEFVILREALPRPRRLIAQRYAPDNTFLGRRIGVYPNDALGSSLAMTPDGGFVAAWWEVTSRWSLERGVFYRRFDRDGRSLGDPVEVTGSIHPEMYYEFHKILPAVDSSGRVLVVWQGRDGHVEARAFDAADEPVGPTTVLVDNPPRLDGDPPPPIYPAIALDDSGRLLVVWEYRDTGLTEFVAGRFFDVTF